jgi:adenylate cyclase
LSYDVPFCFRSTVPNELVMVYVDEKVKANLGQPVDQSLDRRFHAQLVELLRQRGARLILYDIIEDSASTPESDQAFADAIHRHGAVFLCANYVRQEQPGAFTETFIPPIDLLKTNAAGAGLDRLARDRGDGAIRQIDPGMEDCPAMAWVAARSLTNNPAFDEAHRLSERWLNYYGPPQTFRAINLDEALEKDLKPDIFKDKLVVVGGRPTVTVPGADSDAFATAYTRFWFPLAGGAELHALTLLNLLHGDWLLRLPVRWQLVLVILWGLIVGAGLMMLKPWHAAGVAVLAALAIPAIAVYLQLDRHVWWSWAVPAFVQTPLAFVWSVGWQYALESRRRKRLRQAFAGYLSPYMADRIADEDFDLSLGGKVVEATVMFTDLDGFTALSENLDPTEVSKILTSYFSQTTRGILKQEGTIIKYMGDAVMAVWGAPLPEPKHAQRAVLAAWAMVQAGRSEVAGRTLRTRVGINTGKVLAGNLGSEFRSDYTAIGDTTNLASRLEGLNKYLKTELLISEATRQLVDGSIQTRAVGQFLLAGKLQPVTVHEVLGVESASNIQPEWVALFSQALARFVAGELDAAQKLFEQVIVLRSGHDGPSEFYLGQIASARQGASAGPWTGVITLSSK